MTLIEPTADRQSTALAPDLRSLPDRAARAWTERMAGRPRADSTSRDDGKRQLLPRRRRQLAVPARTAVRGEHCKHLRRVAIEITARRVAPPGKQRAVCDACGTVTFVAADAGTPHLCGNADWKPAISCGTTRRTTASSLRPSPTRQPTTGPSRRPTGQSPTTTPTTATRLTTSLC